MAHSKKALIEQGELLLHRLHKAHRAIRKAYKIAAPNEVDLIARLDVAVDSLLQRIATEAITLATAPPLMGMTVAERRERKELLNDVQAITNMAKGLRDLRSNFITDRKEQANLLMSQSSAKDDLIAEAMSKLQPLGLDDQSIPVIIESETWQEVEPAQQ